MTSWDGRKEGEGGDNQRCVCMCVFFFLCESVCVCVCMCSFVLVFQLGICGRKVVSEGGRGLGEGCCWEK